MVSTCQNFADDHIVPDQFSGVKRSRDNSFSSAFSEDELFYKRAKHEDVFSFDPPSSADSGIAIDLCADTTSQLQQTSDLLCNLEAFANGTMNADSSSPAGLYDAPFTSQHCQAPIELVVVEQPEEVIQLATPPSEMLHHISILELDPMLLPIISQIIMHINIHMHI